MNYEQKYKEALERAREIHGQTEFDYEKGMIEEIFPELKESEDEQIRKLLIEHIKVNKDMPIALFEWFSPDRIIAWVEKQKPIDVLGDEEREFADAVDSYRKDMDEFYQKGYDAGREAERQDWLKKQKPRENMGNVGETSSNSAQLDADKDEYLKALTRNDMRLKAI